MANKTLQLKRKTNKYASLQATLSAMSGATITEAEPFIGYYEADGVDHAVLGIGGVNGTPKLFFFDGAEIEAQIEAAIAGLVDGASTSANTLSKLEGLINGLSQDAATYTIVSGTPTETNVKEVYQLQQTINGTSTNVGLPIKIYKDSSLKSVEYITDPSDEHYQNMAFTYILSDGSETTEYVDLGSLIIEAEAASGITATADGVLVGVVDPTSEFLSVGTDGFKVSGVSTAITNAVQALDAIESGSTTHVSVKVTEADGVITDVTVTESDIASANALNDEIGYRKAVTGIDGNAYVTHTTDPIISGATNLDEADLALADAVAALEAGQISIEKGASSEKFLDITKSGTVYTVTVSGITAEITSKINDLDYDDTAVANQFVTLVEQENGVISVERAQVAASGVTANVIAAGNDTVAVTGTTVADQIASLGKTAKSIEDAAYSGITAANNGVEVSAVANNGQTVGLKLNNATDSVTKDLLSIENGGLTFSSTFDCGSW